MLNYLTVCLHIHLLTQDKWLEVDVGLWRDSSSFPRLADHNQPFTEASFIVELSQVRLTVHLDSMLHMRVSTHQTLHITHIKLF